MKKTHILVILFLFVTSVLTAQDARSILTKMNSALSAGTSYEYTMLQTERINGTNHVNKIYTKLNLKPLKIYIDNLEGANEGKELIYVQGERSNKVYINVLFGVALSPFNSKVRKNQHHTILDSGFGILQSTMKDAISRADAEGRFNEVFTYAGDVTFDGRSCYKLVITDPTFTYVDYTISGGESLYQISMKKNVCEQLIIEKNSSLSGFFSAKDGMTIQIPSSYAKKTILYVDKTNNHPIYQEMHDDKGMFEKYEFYSLKVNPTFTANDFSEDNDAYNF